MLKYGQEVSIAARHQGRGLLPRTPFNLKFNGRKREALGNRDGIVSPSIVFGVTSAQSLILLGKLPLKMAKNGWNVTVVCGRESSSYDPWQGHVSIIEIPMAREMAPFRDLLSLFRWVIVLRRLRPSIVSVGTPKAALLGMLAAKLLSVGHRIYMLRGLRLESTAGVRRRVLSLTEKATVACSHRVIAVSKSLGELYVKLRLAPESKMCLIANGSSHGVDLQRFSPANVHDRLTVLASLGLAKDLPVLGFVGRLSQDKGADTLLATAKHLRVKRVSAQFLFVGPIEDSHGIKSALEQECEHVYWVGPVKDPAPFYKVMDILLLPTSREGFPNVVLEAGASGVPVVTTDATGAVDSVIDHETGLVSPLHQSLTFASNVEILVLEEKFRTKLGRAAHKWVTSSFDEIDVEAHYEEFYRRVLRRDI
jgi:glycosyltransferase involved in cell wall biosynthesis